MENHPSDIFYFGNMSDLSDYLNKRIEYDVIDDMVQGNLAKRIVHVSVLKSVKQGVISDGATDVHTLTLLPSLNDASRIMVTFDSSTLTSSKVSAEALVLSITANSSPKARWIDVILLDKSNKQVSAKYFLNNIDSDEEEMYSYVEQYVGSIVSILIRNTQYGFQIDEFTGYGTIPTKRTEVLLAKEYLTTSLKGLPVESYIDSIGLLDTLFDTIGHDVGYELVIMAAELMYINTTLRLTTVRSQILQSMVYASRVYLAKESKVCMRKSTINTLRVFKNIKTKEGVLLSEMLDGFTSEPELDIFNNVQAMVKSIYDTVFGVS